MPRFLFDVESLTNKLPVGWYPANVLTINWSELRGRAGSELGGGAGCEEAEGVGDI